MESIINTITTKLEQDFRKEYEKTISSLEVAEMIGKQHNDLLKDIRRYCEQFSRGKIPSSDFFIESTYLTDRGKEYPCYDVTKKGCEFIANKLTGQKGTEFTAKYINRFHKMEDYIRQDYKPRLEDINKAAEILGGAYRDAGADNRYIAVLVGDIYNENGMNLPLPPIIMDTPKLYDQTMIANEVGMISASGQPHKQAVGAIIKELNISESDKVATPYTNHGHSGVNIQYKESVVNMVREWLKDNNYPDMIENDNKKYKVCYR